MDDNKIRIPSPPIDEGKKEIPWKQSAGKYQKKTCRHISLSRR